MKLAIIGSRNFSNYDLLKCELINFPSLKMIISGGAIGADTLAKRYAIEKKIKILEFKPNYKEFGKVAPIVRNKVIVENCDELVAFWDGKSKGTKFTIDLARKLKKNVKIIIF